MRCVLALLFLSVSVRSVAAQPAVGSYYSGPGNIEGRCPVTPCPRNCSNWQYRHGCAFNSSGSCRDCTGLLANQYFSRTGELTDTCTQEPQRQCSPGFRNLNKNISYAGDCTACPATPPVGSYFKAPTSPSDVSCTVLTKTGCPAGSRDTTYSSVLGDSTCVACPSLSAGNYWKTVGVSPDQCVQESKSICAAGTRLSASDHASTTSKGVCIACDPSPVGFYYIDSTFPSATCNSTQCTDTDCKIGEYKRFCNGTNPGQCSNCTNGNSSSVYATRGGYNNNCLVEGCTLSTPCGIGKYIFGCGLTKDQLSCKDCTNAEVNKTYYTQAGAYDPATCPVTNCPICPNGYYTYGCGGTSAGICSMCMNY